MGSIRLQTGDWGLECETSEPSAYSLHADVRGLYLREEGPQNDLRPGLEVVEVCEQFAHRAEACIEDLGLAIADERFVDIADVDDAEVDLTHGRFVVVDEADALLAIRGVDNDFLGELAEHPF